ncbi:monooxygenase [Sphingobium sp. SCG-1]|uniref:flavin-containing monooxygenase n=1 Tax=Sphingobium sp. SCG-1 TaxID=2072936 RepID=UPI000CD6C2A5|nr:NAD(P)/FAD-dependent oxidoreductase [Sphingobium sp. SCG-1]AUW59670.1 monooxygenase [Sphingobium sp. SCG-1]
MDDSAPGVSTIDNFDADVLAKKYQEEREKRLRAEGAQQYRVIDAGLDAFLDDPYAKAEPSRAPRHDEVEVAIVGGGFGGLLTAARLRNAGIDDLLMIDRASDFGGTWYWNRYPGVACDIEAYIYIPLLEELGSLPSQKYAPGGEILGYAQQIARRYELYERALFQTTVTGMVWNNGAARWEISTNRGDTIHARFVCMSPGPFPWPKLPGIEGIKSFKGKAFHTCRWDYDYTGGAPGHPLLDRLGDKTVGVIGTGATALQCIPPLGRSAKQLYVFQRTPATVGVRGNQPTDPDFAASLKPGWQKERMDNFNATIAGEAVATDMVNDCWSQSLARLNSLAADDPETREKRQIADFRTMEDLRARVEAIVEDSATAASLKPWYNLLCKRPGFHDEYLQTFNLPNVTLVDTDGQGVDRVIEDGVIANGKEYKLDCLIYATGFEFLTDIDHRLGFDIIGRGGRHISELWRNGFSSLFGLHMRDFPNCFILGNAQQAITPNFTYLFNELSQHIAFLVSHAQARGIRTMEPTPEAEKAWVDRVMSFAETRRRFQRDCTPSYLNNEGQLDDQTIRNGFFAGGATAYNNALAEWRMDGSWPGLELT